MKTAYDTTWLLNLRIVKEMKQWQKQNMISKEQYAAIHTQYPSGFFHPNVIIRILLFIATLIALSGVTGLFAMAVIDTSDAIPTLSFLYGLGSFVFLEAVFIRSNHHYKSGVTEALLYHALGFTIGGLIAMADFNEHFVAIVCLIFFSWAAYRYLDLISMVCAVASFAGLVFLELYNLGGVMQQIIPLAFIAVFTPLYIVVKKLKSKIFTDLWHDNLTIAEVLCLLLIYAAGNYLVVRELSVNMMNLYLEDGEDIPLAFVFYILTVAIPVLYLWLGIVKKDIVLLRVSLGVLAFSVFTFKYYYSTGHHEITFTVGGAFLLIVSFLLFRYLKTPRGGFTRENIRREKWADMNAEAFIIAQTLGGNKMPDQPVEGGGGSFGGGGSSGTF